jgi:hypothetical protein
LKRPVELLLLRVVEALDLIGAVVADVLNDVGRLGQLRGELGQPQQRLLELEVVGLGRDLLEDVVARLIELQPVQANRQMVLGDLLVALVVAGLAVDHALEQQRSLTPALGVEQPLGLRRVFRHLASRGRSFIRGLLRGGLAAFLLVEVDLLRRCVRDASEQEEATRQ